MKVKKDPVVYGENMEEKGDPVVHIPLGGKPKC